MSPPAYRIGAGDALAIEVEGDSALSRTVLVRPDGYVTLPLAGEIRAAGLSPEELAAALEAALAQYLVAPRVLVTVIDGTGDPTQQVRIIGAAAKPLVLPYRSGMRIADALAMAGGLSPYADGNAAVLVRGADRMRLALDDLAERGDAAANVALLPGDIIIIPEGLFAGDWQREVSVTLASLYTSNQDLNPRGDADPAVLNAITPEVKVAGKSARFEGALAAGLSAQYVIGTDGGPRLIPNLVATSQADLVRDTLYLDAAASVAELQLSTSSATSAAASNDVNRTLVQTYQVSPVAVARLADTALVQGRYILAGVLANEQGNRSDAGDRAAVDEDIANALTNGFEATISNLPERRSRLQWQGAGYGTYTQRFGDSDITAAGLNASPRYGLTRQLSVVSIAGYSLLDAGSEKLSGPDVAAGLGYEPSPDFSLQALGGWRLENPQADVVMRWDPGPSTRFTASYTDSVGVGQSTLVRSLSDLAYDADTRQFVDQRTRLPFAPQPSGVDINNGLTRTQYAAANLSHAFGVNSVGLLSYLSRQQPAAGSGAGRGSGDTFVSDQTTWGVGASAQRSLTKRMTAKLAVTYSQTDQQSDEGSGGSGGDARPGASLGDFEDLAGGIDVAYRLTDTVQLAAGYRYQQRFAEFEDDRFREHLVLVAVSRRF